MLTIICIFIDLYNNKYPPYNGGYFIFGHSPNTTGCAQVRFGLACQPCKEYLLPVNGLLPKAFLREEGGPRSGGRSLRAHTIFVSPYGNCFSLVAHAPSVPLARASKQLLAIAGRLRLTSSEGAFHKTPPAPIPCLLPLTGNSLFWTPPLWRGFRDTKNRAC